MSGTTVLLLVLLGFGVGVVGTLVGAGGGFILTPLLAILYPEYAPAVITSISLAVVFCNAAVGSIAYARQRRIDFRSGIPFALATLPGAIAGAVVVQAAPARTFDAVLALTLLGLALWLIVRRPRRAGESRTGDGVRTLCDRAGITYRYTPRTRLGIGLSVGVGFVSSFLGIGGGVVHVPLMVQVLGFPTHIATATSHFVLANMAAVATVTHAVAGNLDGGRVLLTTAALAAGVVVGAPAGAMLSRRSGERVIQLVLSVALLAVSVRLLIAAL